MVRKIDNLIVGGDCEFYKGVITVKVLNIGFNKNFKDYYVEIYPIGNPP